MFEWIQMRRELRKLFKEYLHSHILYTKRYTEPENKVFLGGDAPQTIGPGRIEVLFFPDDAKAK